MHLKTSNKLDERFWMGIFFKIKKKKSWKILGVMIYIVRF